LVALSEQEAVDARILIIALIDPEDRTKKAAPGIEVGHLAADIPQSLDVRHK
jgi:hypothetical protein